MSITKNQIDLWIVNQSSQRSDIEDVLTKKEILQASKMKSSKASRQFKRSRHCLRIILAPYLNLEPHKIGFTVGPLGKPALQQKKPALHFNLSHSNNLMVYALSKKPIGIDLEKIKKRPHLDKIAKRFFSKKNYQQFAKLTQAKKTSFFFEVWTATEAYIKALGKGVGSVALIQDKILFSKKNPQVIRSAKWNIFLMSIIKQHSLSVATPLKKPVIRIFTISV